MGQFRTTADVADEVLQKCGEVTNGNSQFESLVIRYLNKAQQAIVGGGNIFSLKVDEVWTWARSKHPLILELEPEYTDGAITATYGLNTIVFSTAPLVSLEGFYIQLHDKRTTYRITQHTAGDDEAMIDSSMLEASGSYAFRTFRLDYDIVPAFIYIDSFTDRLDFVEVGSTQITASLTHGTYTPATLLAHVVARLNATGTNGLYSGSYDTVLRSFTITSSLAGGKIFSMLGATGTNRRRSVLPLLGLDRLNHSGAGSYSSSYVTNGVSRLVEPFRVFTTQATEPFITSTDLIDLTSNYETAFTSKRIPDKFAKIGEDYDGTISIRFNSYPNVRTKVMVDWVPMPIDLQDNDASIPVIPRKEIDVLIHAACAFIAYDKEDDKFDTFIKLTEAQLNAMEKKNRSEMFRTGADFGQIIPRSDYTTPRRLRYGYTVNPGVGTNVYQGVGVQSMIQKSYTYLDFQEAALSKTMTIRSLPADRILFSLIVKHSVAFLGGTISSLLIDVGISGDPTKFVNGFDLMQAVSPSAQDSTMVIYFPGVGTDIQIRVTATGSNLSDLTQGAVDIYIQESGT